MIVLNETPQNSEVTVSRVSVQGIVCSLHAARFRTESETHTSCPAPYPGRTARDVTPRPLKAQCAESLQL